MRRPVLLTAVLTAVLIAPAALAHPTTPLDPTLLGSLRLFQTTTGVALAQEDPDTNDRILLVDGGPTPAGPTSLNVVDVSDRFTKVDAFDAAGRGIFLDGAAPAHLLYCAHWMELQPDFATSGRIPVRRSPRG